VRFVADRNASRDLARAFGKLVLMPSMIRTLLRSVTIVASLAVLGAGVANAAPNVSESVNRPVATKVDKANKHHAKKAKKAKKARSAKAKHHKPAHHRAKKA
jgi:hypothetical protein